MLTTTQNVEGTQLPQFFPLPKSAEQIFATWPLISEYLSDKKKGIPDHYDVGSLFIEILNNPDIYLWVAWDQGMIEGLLLAQFVKTPVRLSLNIIAVNGDNLRKYLPQHKKFEQWGAMLGAQVIAFEAPHALARLLRKYGYSTPTAMVRKSLRPLWSN